MKTENFNVNWNYLKNKKDEKIGVICTIQKNSDKTIISLGVSKCMKCDEFLKEEGFKISLRRASVNTGNDLSVNVNDLFKFYESPFTRKERSEIWEGFRNLSPKKPKWNIKPIKLI
jgi:hypothetical protein